MSALIFKNMPVLENLLHASLGLVRASQELLESRQRFFMAGFQELAYQGSCDHSDLAESMRNRLDYFLNEWHDFTRSLSRYL
jgi:hypothetical protein